MITKRWQQERSGRWIYQQLRTLQQSAYVKSPRQYISGESHYYLGKQYLLKVLEDPNATQQVKLLRGKLEVTVRQKSAEKVTTLERLVQGSC